MRVRSREEERKAFPQAVAAALGQAPLFPGPIPGTHSHWRQVVLASLPHPGTSQAGRLRNRTFRMFERQDLNIDMPVYEITT